MSDPLPDALEKKLENVARDLCGLHGLSLEEVRRPDRRQAVVVLRDEIWNQMREKGYSFPCIGRIFNRDHTSIIAGVKRHEARNG